jgi:hypothetical protein
VAWWCVIWEVFSRAATKLMMAIKKEAEPAYDAKDLWTYCSWLQNRYFIFLTTSLLIFFWTWCLLVIIITFANWLDSPLLTHTQQYYFRSLHKHHLLLLPTFELIINNVIKRRFFSHSNDCCGNMAPVVRKIKSIFFISVRRVGKNFL